MNSYCFLENRNSYRNSIYKKQDFFWLFFVFYEKELNFKTDCKYVSKWTRELQGDEIISYELFNDDLRSDPRGYYLITKEGKVSWTKT